MSNLPAVVNFDELAMPIERLKAQVVLIQTVMRETMHNGEHYGVIPGCGTKPSLLKPGAEKLSTTFRLAPSYDIRRGDLPGGHREYEIVCTLTHIGTGAVVGQGVGSCSTMESKYRWRNAERKCPQCGNATIIKGKKEYGGGWVCFAKKGGCGAKFEEGDNEIEGQEVGRVEHDNPADYYNTVLKISKKRAHVDAVLTATAASDIFTQDIEDMVENGSIEPKKPEPEQPKPDTRKHSERKPAEPTIKPCTKAQFDELQKKANETWNEAEAPNLRLGEMVAHFRKGAKLSTDEAKDLIDNWDKLLAEYAAHIEAQNDQFPV